MPEASPVLTIHNLSTIFASEGGGLHALDRLSFEVSAEEFVCVLGPSGCGKSTLARCLAGLIPHLYRGEMRGQVWVGDLRTDRQSVGHHEDQWLDFGQPPECQQLVPGVGHDQRHGRPEIPDSALSGNKFRGFFGGAHAAES